MRTKKIVYVAMCADIVHPGHLNIINEAARLGEVTVGLLTDEAVASKKRLPFMSYEHRLQVVSSIKGVDRVIAQATADYRPNLLALKPSFVVHGDDWLEGSARRAIRQQVIDTLAEWGGQLVELKYTDGISSTLLNQKLKAGGISPAQRLAKLSRLIEAGITVKALEAHNGLSALIVEQSSHINQAGKTDEFEAVWVSSLTDSIAKGKPDIELVDRSSRLATINEILEVTTKPIIVDGDTGSHKEHFVHTVRTLERLGVSAVVIEDKSGLKRNSLHKQPADHTQEDTEAFTAKLRAGLEARLSTEFMVIARIESLVLGKGLSDAMTRAKAYIAAGASGIVIHSKDKRGADAKKFAAAYSKLENRPPLVMIPTSYNEITNEEMAAWGANIIVYANQLLRAAYPAMQQAAESILERGRGHEAESHSISVKDFLEIIPED